MEATFVIVGGGIAGVSCAENLAFLCPNETIILLTESSLIKTVTNLVPLGKALTKFDVEERDSSTLDKKVTVVVDVLDYISTENQEIRTKDKRIIKYTYLCLCTGARPKLIEDNNDFIIGIRDTESVLEFQKHIKSSKRLVLVGNGGIASEIAYEVKNVELHWVIKDDYISSTFLDPGAAQFLQNNLLSKNNKNDDSGAPAAVKRMRYADDGASTSFKKGAALGPDWHRLIDITGNAKDLPETVKIHYKCEVKSVEVINKTDNNYPLQVTLTNDEVIHCDFLVSATGVDPQITYKCDKEFKLGKDGGIFVNEMMETNLPSIYAAGDVCYAGWEYSQHWFQMRLWTQARQMGAMAGKSMAAKFNNEKIYQDFCFESFGHVTKFFGFQVVLLGRYNGQGLGNDYEILVRVTPNKEYIKFVIKESKLQGVILIGETGLEETCENLILNQLDLAPYGDDILNPDIDIEDYFD